MKIIAALTLMLALAACAAVQAPPGQQVLKNPECSRTAGGSYNPVSGECASGN